MEKVKVLSITSTTPWFRWQAKTKKQAEDNDSKFSSMEGVDMVPENGAGWRDAAISHEFATDKLKWGEQAQTSWLGMGAM